MEHVLSFSSLMENQQQTNNINSQVRKLVFQSISPQIAGHILAYSNSCVNPILYAFLSPPFRTGFRQLLTCVTSRHLDTNGNRSQQLTPRTVKVITITLIEISVSKKHN